MRAKLNPLKILLMMPVSLVKKNLRARMRKIRSGLGDNEIISCGQAANNILISSSQWKNASTVALYMALPHELPTRELLENARCNGKEVWLPKIVDARQGKMEFAPFKNMETLAPGAMGIMEPAGNKAFTSNFRPDLIIVPGLAFDMRGFRLGYGGGYYDRWLSGHSTGNCRVCGMAFACQIVDVLPHDSWDMRVNGICTEEGLVWL